MASPRQAGDGGADRAGKRRCSDPSVPSCTRRRSSACQGRGGAGGSYQHEQHVVAIHPPPQVLVGGHQYIHHSSLLRLQCQPRLTCVVTYPLIPPPIGPRLGHILLSLLRLVPAPGISSCPSSDLSPPRVHPLVPPPIGPRLGYILLSLLRW
eukprot:6223399-Pyramimonas_sp.AAC.1